MTILGPDRLDEAVSRLRAGEVVAIPTDTVYGLAALPDDAVAVRQLATLKGRAPEQPIALLVDDIASIEAHVTQPDALRAIAALWPGALTAVVSVGKHFAAVVTEAGTVGVRVPDDDLARAVIRGCGGALAVTSANASGEPPALSAAEVVAAFGEALTVLDGGSREGGVASTVVDLTVEPIAVLREGPISASEIRGLLGVR